MMHRVIQIVPYEDGRLRCDLAPVIEQLGQLVDGEWVPSDGYYVVAHSTTTGVEGRSIRRWSWTPTLEEARERRDREERQEAEGAALGAAAGGRIIPMAYPGDPARYHFSPDFVVRVEGVKLI